MNKFKPGDIIISNELNGAPEFQNILFVVINYGIEDGSISAKLLDEHAIFVNNLQYGVTLTENWYRIYNPKPTYLIQ